MKKILLLSLVLIGTALWFSLNDSHSEKRLSRSGQESFKLSKPRGTFATEISSQKEGEDYILRVRASIQSPSQLTYFKWHLEDPTTVVAGQTEGSLDLSGELMYEQIIRVRNPNGNYIFELYKFENGLKMGSTAIWNLNQHVEEEGVGILNSKPKNEKKVRILQ